MRSTRELLLSWLIISVVPVLNIFRRGYPWSTSFEELEEMSEDSWGYQLRAYLQERGLRYLPKYQQHDALHILLEYDTSPLHEVRLQAFMVGNGSSSFAGHILYRIGQALLPENRDLIQSDFERGAASASIDWWVIEAEVAKPLSLVRETWSICPAGIRE